VFHLQIDDAGPLLLNASLLLYIRKCVALRSSTVIEIGTNQNLTCDFLLVFH